LDGSDNSHLPHLPKTAAEIRGNKVCVPRIPPNTPPNTPRLCLRTGALTSSGRLMNPMMAASLRWLRHGYGATPLLLVAALVLITGGCGVALYPFEQAPNDPMRFVYDERKELEFTGVVLYEFHPDREWNLLWEAFRPRPVRGNHFEVNIGSVPEGWFLLYPKSGALAPLEPGHQYVIEAGNFIVVDKGSDGLHLGRGGGMMRLAECRFIWQARPASEYPSASPSGTPKNLDTIPRKPVPAPGSWCPAPGSSPGSSGFSGLSLSPFFLGFSVPGFRTEEYL
jgi:hypothetical protein